MEAYFEADDLAVWMQDLVNAEAKVVPAARAVVVKGALNVKVDARSRFNAARVGNYLPHYARAISYEVTEYPAGSVAEIGPESDMPQGGMGKGVELGSVRHPPIPHLNPALDAEAPKFEVAAADVGVRALS